MKPISFRIEFKREDLWIGCYWKTTHATTDQGKVPFSTDIWICLVPCVPIHLTVFHGVLIEFDPKENVDVKT